MAISDQDNPQAPTQQKSELPLDVIAIPFQQRVRGTLKTIITGISVEPLLFLFMFSQTCLTVSYQDFLLTRSCEQYLNATREECANLTNDKALRDESQKYGSIYYNMYMLMYTLPATFVGAFLGPWSDKYGRRYTLMFAIVGSFTNGTILVTLAAIDNVPVYLIPLPSLISGLTGGMLILLTSCYSYMSDITNEKNRTVRFGFAEFSSGIAVPLGTLVGGQIYKVGGYISVFMVYPICYILAFLWVVFFLKETKIKPENSTMKIMFRDLASTRNLKECVHTFVRKRPGNLRAQFWLMLLCLCISTLILLGSITVGYLYAQTMFKWDVPVYSNVSSMFKAISSIMTVLSVAFLTKVLKVQDGVLGLIGSISTLVENIVIGVAYEDWIYYLGKTGGSMNSCLDVAVKTRLPKLVEPNEIGKVFSLLGVCQSLAPIIGSSMSTAIYNGSVKFFPGLVYIVMGGFCLIPAVTFIWITRQSKTIIKGNSFEDPSGLNVNELREVPSEVKDVDMPPFEVEMEDIEK